MADEDREPKEWTRIHEELLDDADEPTDGGNLLVKIQLPKRDEQIEWEFEDDEPNADVRLRSSLRQLLSSLEPSEEVLIDLELRLRFEPDPPAEREGRELLEAQTAAKRLSASALETPKRTLVFGPFDPTPNSPSVSTPPNEVEKPLVSIMSSRVKPQKPPVETDEKTDVTQRDSSIRESRPSTRKPDEPLATLELKNPRIYFTPEVQRLERISLEVADELESPVTTDEKKRKRSPQSARSTAPK